MPSPRVLHRTGRPGTCVRPLTLLLGWLWIAAGLESSPGAGPAANWSHGPPTDPSWFPIGVWLQSPERAPRYREAGINLYVGLWKGPTPDQLDRLDKAGMKVICAQNDFARSQLGRSTIIGWMHGDEPDNAQPLPAGGGYGPPIQPDLIVRDYESIRSVDPSRPILLNLGQGVAWDDYIGRGVRRNHPEDYPQYVRGCDIASFDIYPAVHDHPSVAGRLEFVARGVERLRSWAGPDRTVWNCIECTRISNPNTKPTPAQVRSEVWMSLIRGSRGIIYFVHQFKPVFREAAVLEDPAMLAALTSINRQVRELAPFLNAPDAVGPDVPVLLAPAGTESTLASITRRRGRELHLYAVNLAPAAVTAGFRWVSPTPPTQAVALGEDRRLPLVEGKLTDTFGPYEVHLYRLESSSGAAATPATVPRQEGTVLVP